MSTRLTTVLNTQSDESTVNNGVVRGDRKALSIKLSEALADSYMLNIKTQIVHWNISGPLFHAVHQLTEEQYQDINEAIDIIAERIRAIGFLAPATLGQLRHYSSIKDAEDDLGAIDMVKDLVEANELISKNLRFAVEAAEIAKDVSTADLLTSRIGQHEKFAWMLRSLIS
ncbi:DNA starvation/stationary phase protection protein [Aliikangiella marina]|uniref:DNA starvation/stationary phase protection protein n=1 Tax=Aliikangiella marina TaxID=1712262 RepID=A0A545TJR8_9GAMM|nr:DNA starvation/stationary phase protection protein [Aliikangiella marina]TQV77401.1 DNA starvation/stationary phase protection protein [Aliikangiella marina]